MSAANSQNSSCAVAGRMRSIPKLNSSTNASGASMNSHFIGLTNSV